MSITIIQKSDLTVKKSDPKVALVLAGGAVTGGAFKLGGLKALDDFLVNRKTTDFDIYVGLSAGAILAAPLALGISPAEMFRSLEGTSDTFTPFRSSHLYHPNLREFRQKLVRYVIDLAAFVPGSLWDIAFQSPAALKKFPQFFLHCLRQPTRHNFRQLYSPFLDTFHATREFPFPLDYLPSGLFDNSAIERYLRHNLRRHHLTNDFKVLYRQRKKQLYIVAMKLDTAERVVFGHDEDDTLNLSEAVQASTALPGFYKPARIKGVDYVDGGVRRTADIDVAAEHGADLIICYNPFRPFTNAFFPEATPLADKGGITVLNQVLRTLLHTRIQYSLRAYQDDPHFHGDIILIEPEEQDFKFFQMNLLSFWQGTKAAQHGYLSVCQSIADQYQTIKTILESYGITMAQREIAQHPLVPAEDMTDTLSPLSPEFPSNGPGLA